MTLENLLRIKQLHHEPPDPREIKNLITAAIDRINDAQISSLSYASRFDLAYNSSYGFALAALRRAGFRTDKRYLVFQCLIHTTLLCKSTVRIFSICHEKRNLAEYEGHFEKDMQLLKELIKATLELKDFLKTKQ